MTDSGRFADHKTYSAYFIEFARSYTSIGPKCVRFASVFTLFTP